MDKKKTYAETRHGELRPNAHIQGVGKGENMNFNQVNYVIGKDNHAGDLSATERQRRLREEKKNMANRRGKW